MDTQLNAIIVKVQKELYAQYGMECAELTNTIRNIQSNCKNLSFGQKKLVLMSSIQQIVTQYGK